MKHLLFFVLLISLFTRAIEAQTNANIPRPENVLVVYNSNSLVSDSVMQYYVNVRGIPYPQNVFELNNLVNHNITIDGVTHRVGLAQNQWK